MNLTQAQATIARDKHRFRVGCWGRRTGKTTEAIEEIKGKVAAGKKKIAYIASTYQQARDIAWETLKKEFDGAIFNEARLEIKVGNCLIVLRGWESIETLRGQSFDFIVIDEVAMVRNFWAMWQEVIRPTLTDTKGGALFISTPKGFNHFYDLFNLEHKDADFKSFHFTSYDNPHLPREEIDKAREELTEDRFAQEYLADFRKTEGLVYKEFDRKLHLFDDSTTIYDKVETLAGVDFGFTNPTAIPTIVKDYNGHFWIVDEYYKTGQTEPQVAEYVSASRFNKVYPDPESPSAIKELRNRGVNVREVLKNKDSIKNGINKVKELFKAGKLHVHKRCLNTIFELETYSYPDKKDGHNENEVPIDENNHMMDAIRYVVYMQPIEGEQRRAGTYIPGDLVRAPQTGAGGGGMIERIRAKMFIPKNLKR